MLSWDPTEEGEELQAIVRSNGCQSRLRQIYNPEDKQGSLSYTKLQTAHLVGAKAYSERKQSAK